jgi:hypothetical protein
MSPNPRLDRVLAQLRLYEHPLLDFDARAKGDSVELIIQFKNPRVPVHTNTSISTHATWTIRNLNGASSVSSTIACTITWWKCSSARRKTASSANGKACDPAPEN